ncbi:MAG: M28 family peptidase [Anaerolineales bacterium]|nr:M28 family peptidase [Anaerolineales bacterium]
MTDNTQTSKVGLQHIKYLAETIGGRGSCTEGEREAGTYVADQLHNMGVSQVHNQRFLGVASTYRPYVLAFSSALLGTILVWSFDTQVALLLGSILNALGALGMWAETDISPSWMRRFIPKRESLNVIGILPAIKKPNRKAVLCAHLDTHRTPVFYSSPTWHKLFGALVAAGLLSMFITAVFYGLGAVLAWDWVRWIGLGLASMVIFSLSLCIQADLTPHSPGANDNASGVAAVLAIADRLVQTPLENTEVWTVFTGCEEVGAYGMQSFLDTYAANFDDEVVFLILDEVGFGVPKFLSKDGIIRRYQTHPLAMELASRAARSLPEIDVLEKTGIAYTDALVATKRGFIALSIGTHVDSHEEEVSHWHQMSDTVETIQPATLEKIHTFTWALMKEIDQWKGLPNGKLNLEKKL